MTTALDLANRSLKLILVEAADSPLEADEYQDYYDALNDFMADLESRGIRLGFTSVSNPSDTVTVPDGAIRGIIANMAVEVAPDYGGKVSPALVSQAESGMTTLRRLGMKRITASYPSTLPRGTGNDDYPYRSISHYEAAANGIMSLVGNTKATPIAAVSTPVLVRGEWKSTGMEVLRPDVAGRLENVTGDQHLMTVEVKLTATAPSACTGSFIIMRNGAEQVRAVSRALTTARADVTINAAFYLEPGEYFELYVSNTTGTEDITVADAIVQVT